MYQDQLDNNFVSIFLFYANLNRGTIMKKSTLFKFFIALPLAFTVIAAQTDTDAIEKARQAKEAAEKAAAEAAAATEAAIEQAAQKAAAEAREEAKRKKEEDEARKIAEQKAAEEAELDAAAARAAEEAKRKMAAELGLEYEGDEAKEGDSSTSAQSASETPEVTDDLNAAEEVVAKESSGYNLGLSGSFGFIQGDFFDNIPTGGSVVISTPWGFDLGGLRLGLSATLGAYPAKHNTGESFTPLAIGVGGNLTLGKLLFTEGHVGRVGDAMGLRGFAGVSLERIAKNVDLPFNLLIGAEGFVSTTMKEGLGSVNDDGTGGSGTYWGGLAFRIDYNL